MSRINVDFIAFNDVRFVRLAQLLGYADHDHARSKVEYLWLECTNRGVTKLPQWVVESLLGPEAPAALIESELARWSGGRGDSKTRLMHICGTEERCLWKRAKGEQSSKGGKNRAKGAQRTAGRFAPAMAGDTAPAETSAPAPAPAPAPKRESASRSKPKHQVAEDWQPINFPSLTASERTELERFRNHHRSKGNTFVDIAAAWRNWLSRSAEYALNRPANGNGSRQPEPQRNLTWIKPS